MLLAVFSCCHSAQPMLGEAPLCTNCCFHASTATLSLSCPQPYRKYDNMLMSRVSSDDDRFGVASTLAVEGGFGGYFDDKTTVLVKLTSDAASDLSSVDAH